MKKGKACDTINRDYWEEVALSLLGKCCKNEE